MQLDMRNYIQINCLNLPRHVERREKIYSVCTILYSKLHIHLQQPQATNVNSDQKILFIQKNFIESKVSSKVLTWNNSQRFIFAVGIKLSILFSLIEYTVWLFILAPIAN